MEFKHTPVMLEECMQALKLYDGGIWFDGTLGGAGHSEQILKRTSPHGKLIAIDRDLDAIQAARARLSGFEGRFELINDNFKQFGEIISEQGVVEVDGILLDLGVSSYQLDNRERGFSYLAAEVPLDMRMDRNQVLNARTVVNEYSEKELSRILYEYGEERFARNIANTIIKEREKAPIETTGELVKIIEKAIPKKFQNDGHPAKRTFQAIRIEVNEELGGLKECIVQMAKSLKKGGRIAIITFHSLEDRIVKQAFKELETDCVCPKEFPVCVCGKRKEIQILTKKPITASESELLENSRSKSAKLRVAERI